MPIHERDRIRFHGWLLQHDLDEGVADAILATMPPYDWHELATKADLAVMEQRIADQFVLVEARFVGTDLRFAGTDLRFDGVDKRFDQVDQRFDQMDQRFDRVDRGLDSFASQVDRRFDQFDQRMEGMALEIRAIMFTLIGLIVSVLLAGAAAMFG